MLREVTGGDCIIATERRNVVRNVERLLECSTAAEHFDVVACISRSQIDFAIDHADAVDELRRSKAYLEEAVQCEVVDLAYPDGSYTRPLVESEGQQLEERHRPAGPAGDVACGPGHHRGGAAGMAVLRLPGCCVEWLECTISISRGDEGVGTTFRDTDSASPR